VKASMDERTARIIARTTNISGPSIRRSSILDKLDPVVVEQTLLTQWIDRLID
jgi:hypothetical protein